MRPIKLEIEGLQSFKEKQVIDFETLCQYGIFGIFGETGSGKSTILDGIILALYGEIPKEKDLAQSEGGLTNFLNNFSDKMEVYFKFALEEDIFEISRKYYLGKEKGVDKLKTKEVLMKKNGEIIADKASQIVEKLNEDFGLNLENFKRTVVLPQGKFSEFLKLRGDDKRKNLENIFSMEEYGKKLKDRANLEKKSLENIKQNLNSQKENIEETSLEDIENFQKKLNDNKILLEKLNFEKIDFDKYYTDMANLREIIQKYNRYLDKKSELDSKKNEIDSKKDLVDKSQKADSIKTYINENDALNSSLISNEKNLKNFNISKEKLEYQLNILKNEIEDLENNYNKLELQKEKIDFNSEEYLDISNAYSDKKIILDKDKNIERENKNISQCEKNILDFKRNIIFFNDTISNLDEKISALPKINENDFEILNSKIIEIKNILEKYEENKKDKENINASLEKLEEEKAILEESKKNIIEKLEIFEKEKIKNLAFELAKTLEEGKPCPVCGATHHIHIDFKDIKNFDIDGDIKKYSLKKENLIDKIGKIQGKINNQMDRKLSLKVLFEGKILEESDFESLKLKLSELNEILTNKKREFQEIEAISKKLQNDKIKALSDLTNLKNNLSREEKNLVNSKESLNSFLREKEISLNKIKNFKDISLEELEQRKEKLEKNQKLLDDISKKIKLILASKNDKIKKKEDLNEDLNKKIIDISKIKSDMSHIKEKIDNNFNTINLLLEKYNFQDEEEVKKYYLNDREKESLNQEIKFYEESVIKLTTLLEESEKSINGRVLTEDKWQEIEEKKNDLEEKITQLKVNISSLEKDLTKKRENLSKISGIDKEIRKINKKLNVAEDIYQKLRSKDFVSFLINKKLQNVVESASKRLNNISNGRYRLVSDENSNFYVVDFFNEGKRRRTATLSGGETFVVSLCLALALSKQLQLKGKKPLEFFFLDEGFGSLDSKLLDKVMDSIENIRNEEKIKIGIITHLEELKLRILKRIEVEKAIPGERGSKIKII